MGWSIIAIVIAAYVGFKYVYVPLLVRSQLKSPADPHMEAVTDDDPRVPAEGKTFSHEIARQLAPLGFSPAVLLLHADPGATTVGHVAVFTNRATGDQAAAMTVVAQARGGAVMRSYVAEFSTELTDETSITTNNGLQAPGVIQPPWRTLQIIPGLADLAQLYRVHRGLVTRRGTAKNKAESPQQIVEGVRASMLREWRSQVERGYLYLDSAQNCFRPTVIGGLLNVWALMWPAKDLRRWLLARKARRLLADAGLPTSYSAVDYAQLVKQRQQENPEPAAPLQFERAEYAVETPALSQTLSCKRCGAAITDQYWESGGAVVCQACRIRAEAVSGFGARVGRFSKATFYGLLAAIVGSAIWFGIRAATGYDLGIVAIVVGLMVGATVKAGSGGRGGWRYQTIAILLTYCAIVASWVPSLAMRAPEDVDAPTSARATATSQTSVADEADADHEQRQMRNWSELGAGRKTLRLVVTFVVLFVLIVPMMIMNKSLIGLLIVGFAIYEAWKINKRTKSSLSGPYSIAAAPPTAGGAPAPPASPAV